MDILEMLKDWPFYRSFPVERGDFELEEDWILYQSLKIYGAELGELRPPYNRAKLRSLAKLAEARAAKERIHNKSVALSKEKLRIGKDQIPTRAEHTCAFKSDAHPYTLERITRAIKTGEILAHAGNVKKGQ